VTKHHRFLLRLHLNQIDASVDVHLLAMTTPASRSCASALFPWDDFVCCLGEALPRVCGTNCGRCGDSVPHVYACAG
jgi:hypothetical protein